MFCCNWPDFCNGLAKAEAEVAALARRRNETEEPDDTAAAEQGEAPAFEAPPGITLPQLFARMSRVQMQ